MFKVLSWEPKTLKWWSTQRTKIDMDPPYQRRGKLWSTIDKAFLIDSILNDLDIPKLYVADFNFGNTALNQRNLPYAIIDGKQRFEAIFDFFEGRLLLNQDFEYFDDPSLDLGQLSYDDLRKNYPEIADKFDNYSLTIMRVITDDEAKINELFVRLNRSKPLTGAEIRNAMAGIVPRLIRRLAGHAFFQERISFQTKRGGDKNAAAKLLLIEFRGRLVDTKRTNLDRFVAEGIDAQSDDLERAAGRATSRLDEMAVVFSHHDPLLSFAGVLPVYYWFVRNVDREERGYIREFLVNFDRERRANRSKTGVDAATADQELIAFELFNRSANDQRSHEGRFKILMRRWAQYRRRKDARAEPVGHD